MSFFGACESFHINIKLLAFLQLANNFKNWIFLGPCWKPNICLGKFYKQTLLILLKAKISNLLKVIGWEASGVYCFAPKFMVFELEICMNFLNGNILTLFIMFVLAKLIAIVCTIPNVGNNQSNIYRSFQRFTTSVTFLLFIFNF